jgi:peptidoglycan hydrolase CwlO-like protein
MQSRSPVNHDPYEHFATREALAEVATRLDATLPHLATKADVERMGNRLLFWLTGTLVTCLLTFYGLHSNLMAAQQAELARLHSSQQEQLAEIRRISEQIDRLARERNDRQQQPRP